MLRFLILAGYFEISMYLQITGKLDQYINIHYSYLAYISMVLSFILALVQLVIWMKNLKLHSHLNGRWARLSSPFILVFPVLVSLFIPTVTLDSTTVSAKGYSFPVAAGNTGELDSNGQTVSDDGTTIQYLKPDTSLYFTKTAYHKEMSQALKKYDGDGPLSISTDNYMEVMELIYLYPDAFLNRQITYTGFVYNEAGHQGYQFLFRFGIIHCIADSGVYGLLTTGADQAFEDNTWLTATGSISMEYDQSLNQTLPVLYLTSSQVTSQPENPYVYRIFD